uniref:Uncharacterized protein n=2 Tax=Canis lupus TaxID=9612 RepID=A0A8C0YZT6_CANLF
MLDLVVYLSLSNVVSPFNITVNNGTHCGIFFFLLFNMKTSSYLHFYMCFLIIDKPVLLSGFFLCIYVLPINYFCSFNLVFFYFVLCKLGKILKSWNPSKTNI